MSSKLSRKYGDFKPLARKCGDTFIAGGDRGAIFGSETRISISDFIANALIAELVLSYATSSGAEHTSDSQAASSKHC